MSIPEVACDLVWYKQPFFYNNLLVFDYLLLDFYY